MYSFITSEMTWSYSRISAFDTCPYKFFLTYIKPCVQVPLFFSDYGTYMHKLLSSFYALERTKDELVLEYLSTFKQQIRGKAPDTKLFVRYFGQGLEHLKALQTPLDETLGVELEVNFELEGFPFIGYIDRLARDFADNRISIWDHKSHALKKRSVKGKYTRSDEELDAYLRQLYLYSIPVEKRYGVLPKRLVFNCYRTGDVIREPFRVDAYEASKMWALNSIRRIIAAKEWRPNMNYYFCKHICGVHDSCEYYNMEYGRNGFRTARAGGDF